MNTYSRLAVAFCACAGAACQPAVDVESVETEVRAVLNRYIASVEQEDMERYAQIVAHDADMTNFGAFGGPIIGWDGLQGVMEGQNAMLDAIQVDQSDVKVHVLASGDNAWATSLWQFKATAGETPLDLPVRCTWQLERRDGGWQIVHFHKSIAAGERVHVVGPSRGAHRAARLCSGTAEEVRTSSDAAQRFHCEAGTAWRSCPPRPIALSPAVLKTLRLAGS